MCAPPRLSWWSRASTTGETRLRAPARTSQDGRSPASTWAVSSCSAEGRLRPVVERSCPLEEAGQAHERSETGRVHGKLLLVVDQALAAHVPGPAERATHA